MHRPLTASSGRVPGRDGAAIPSPPQRGGGAAPLDRCPSPGAVPQPALRPGPPKPPTCARKPTSGSRAGTTRCPQSPQTRRQKRPSRRHQLQRYKHLCPFSSPGRLSSCTVSPPNSIGFSRAASLVPFLRRFRARFPSFSSPSGSRRLCVRGRSAEFDLPAACRGACGPSP